MDSISSIEYIWFLEILTELVDKWGENLATTQILDLCETAQNTNYFAQTAKDKTWILVCYWCITDVLLCIYATPFFCSTGILIFRMPLKIYSVIVRYYKGYELLKLEQSFLEEELFCKHK